MTTPRHEQAGRQGGLSAEELAALEVQLTNADPPLSYFLALSGHWSESSLPRVDLTNSWAMPFYRGFYPELPSEDKSAYRTLCRLDGDVWLDLKRLLYWMPARDYMLAHGQPAATEIAQVNYIVDRLQPKLNGLPLDLADEADYEAAWTSEVVRKRIEEGMSRQLRVFSAMAARSALDSRNTDAVTHLGFVEESVLDLTADEQLLVSNLYSRGKNI